MTPRWYEFGIAAALIGAVATAAIGQTTDPVEQLSLDLDRDGFADMVSVYALPDEQQEILIENGRADGSFGTAARAFLAASRDPSGPTLEITPAGSLAVTVECFACGRTHSRDVYTVAWRNNAIFLAGFTSTVADRLFAQVIVCDVNLLSGKADRGLIDFDVQRVDAPFDRAFPFADVTPTYRPQVCADMPVYDDDLLQRLQDGN